MRTDARIDEPLRVLIIEDEVLLAIDLESHLEALGQEIVGLAGDATQALALADVEHPDLALVDINLRDGRTGLVISSKLGAGYDTTAVLVTGSPEQIPADYAGAIGALTKPCDQKCWNSWLCSSVHFASGGATPACPRLPPRCGWRRSCNPILPYPINVGGGVR